MAWGQITIGAMVLKETDTLTDATNANTGERAVKLDGAETVPGTTLAQLEALQEDILGLLGRTFPVQFSRKSTYNGFYTVTDANSEYEKWVQGPAQTRWSLALTYLGPDNIVDFESRLATVVRANDYSLTGERWHAPPIGHYSYYVGTATPATVTRTGADGAITVYRAIPASLSPRWGSLVAGYTGGRVRILQGGLERLGTAVTLTPTGWEINNGLVRVQAETVGTATLRVGVWSGGAWRDKAWSVTIAGVVVSASTFKAATVLRNDPEMCTLRVIAQPVANNSRHIIDISIRRGSRFAECFVQRPAAGGIDVKLITPETQTDNTVASGYVVATANDANGNRFVVGSSKTVTAVTGGISRAATTTMDFYVGCEIGGTGAVAGDTATAMRDQYIGAMAEQVGVIRR